MTIVNYSAMKQQTIEISNAIKIREQALAISAKYLFSEFPSDSDIKPSDEFNEFMDLLKRGDHLDDKRVPL